MNSTYSETEKYRIDHPNSSEVYLCQNHTKNTL